MERNIKINRRSQLIVGTIILVALIGVLVINNDHASAQKNSGWTRTEQAESTTSSAEDSGLPGFTSTAMPSMFKLASALVLVIVCIYLGVWGLKKTMGKKYSGNRQYNALEVLETTYVAPKKSVSLVRVADKAVLIGVTEENIAVLTELNREETASLLAVVEQEETTKPGFMTFMNAASQKLKDIGIKRTENAALDA